MRDRVQELLRQANKESASAQAQAAVGLIRILLQHAAIALAEWVIDRLHSGHDAVLDQEIDLSALRAPSEGTLVDVLLNLIIVGENLGWAGIAQIIWAPLGPKRPSHEFSTTQNATLESVLRGYVSWRNDDVFGHGLADEGDHVGLLDVATLLVDRLAPLLPEILPDGRMVLCRPSSDPLTLKVLRAFGSDLVCYRNIRMIANGRCIVRGQRQLDLLKKEEVSWEAEDVLAFRARSEKAYSFWETGDTSWCPLVLVSSRLTHHFSGRKAELSQLKDWADDLESRACMLYGDGGMGKTTLAVEFVHRLLDGSIASKWKPDMVTFYTAKQTRWGPGGVEHTRVTAGNVIDLAAEVYRNLSGQLADRSWFDKSVDAVVDKLAAYLAEWRIARKDHLLVIDNTETMATNEAEVRALADHVRKLERKVGRILITSRRRELIEALPIEVPALAPDESVALLRNRAMELGSQPILQAGDRRLRNIVQQLANRPLTLEVFIQTLNQERLSLERALERVLQMERTDLGEFLYSDAWRRLSPRMQALLVTMTKASDLLEESLVKLCCKETGVQLMEAYGALAESRGIATVRRVDGHTEVVLNPDFIRFASDKQVRIDGAVFPSAAMVESIKQRYIEYLNAKTAEVRDRINVAYRTPFARMAAQAFKEGRFDECRNAYEMAIAEDGENGQLFERYADALFAVRRDEEALVKATEATRLAPRDPECWFTRGMIESRLGLAEQAEETLAHAAALGKPRHLCRLKVAHAYANTRPARVADAFAALVAAKEAAIAERTGWGGKHLAELGMLERRLSYLAATQ